MSTEKEEAEKQQQDLKEEEDDVINNDVMSNNFIISSLKEIKNDVIKLEDNISSRNELNLDIRYTKHWVLKIGNLSKSIEFYTKIFGMKVFRHEEFDDGCDAKCNGDFQRPWSKTMIGYGTEKTNFALELTYNYGIKGYKRGNDLRFIGLNITKNGIKIANELGYKVNECDDSKLFYDIIGPDDIKYRCRICNLDKLPKEPFWSIALNVINVENTLKYWVGLLNFQCIEFIKNKYLRIQSFGNQIPIEFYQLNDNEKLNHFAASGRIAFTTKIKNGVYILEKYLKTYPVSSRNVNIGKIHTNPITLKTPGKTSCDVIILQDIDNYEICFVNQDGFDDLCTTKDGDDKIDWDKRKEKGADQDKGKFVK